MAHAPIGGAPQLKVIEDLSSKLEAAGVVENKYTEHTVVSITQMHDALLKVRPQPGLGRPRRESGP